MGVIAGDNECHDHAEPADPFIAGVAQLAIAVNGICLCAAPDGQLREHNGNTNEDNNSQINKNIGSAASLVGFPGKFPDVPESDG